MGAGMASAPVGFIAFAPALRSEFVYDDLVIILNNPTVCMPGPWYRFCASGRGPVG